MSPDAELRDILREHEGDLLAFARKAYEHGYRQGLASRPPSAALPAPEPPPSPPPPGPLFAESPPDPADADEADVEVDEPEDDDDKDAARPVRSSITVGGLVKKINRHFGLGRFDIAVLVVDPRSHRHLKRGVRLSRYLLEGE